MGLRVDIGIGGRATKYQQLATMCILGLQLADFSQAFA
jgi:hypothetical protein